MLVISVTILNHSATKNLYYFYNIPTHAHTHTHTHTQTHTLYTL